MVAASRDITGWDPAFRELFGRALEALDAVRSSHKRFKPEQLRWRMHPATFDEFRKRLEMHELMHLESNGAHTWALFKVEVEQTIHVDPGRLELVTLW